MKRALLVLICGCLVVGVAPAVYAGVTNASACISTHIGPSITKLPCDNQPSLNRFNIVTRVDVGVNCLDEDWNIWLLVCNGSDSLGIAGMEFGIDYDGALGSGMDVNAYTLCGDLEFPNPNFPDAGTGNIITWIPQTNCQDQNSEPFVAGSVIAIGGVLNVQLYSPDQLSITPRPVSGFAKVADCNSAETNITGLVPSHLGVAGFCMPGYNPCFAPTPVEDTTWGRLKGKYN